ncbi:MAG: glutathionylspermidine synthase family protein [Proteobacteria bacterium]|nr:glutathionylspermidine synthase family protein [Pseudomonadota bacterium]
MNSGQEFRNECLGMRIHCVNPQADFNTFLQEEAGYHIWNGYDYIESEYVAEISKGQADFLSSVAEEMYRMCITAVDRVITENRFTEFGIGPLQAKHIIASWNRAQAGQGGISRDPELYGRFDFCWDGADGAKFYEINADTPTTAYECSVVQWVVVNDLIKRGELPGHMGQFNSLEEKIIDRMTEIRGMTADRKIDKLHFSCMTDWKEDLTTTSYLEELAKKAGWNTKFIDIGLVGANENVLSKAFGNFYDTDNEEIKALYKLMPWEHIYESSYAQYVMNDKILFIEPPWKAILSNKMLSVLLWEMYPGHPYLLPAYTSPERLGNTYVEKPIFGRISAGVRVIQDKITIGERRYDPDEPLSGYLRYPKIYQQFCPLPYTPGLPGWRYQTGLWVVGNGNVAGMDLRIDKSLVTGGGTIKFLPHVMDLK